MQQAHDRLRQNNVVSTSMQRQDVASTLIQHCLGLCSCWDTMTNYEGYMMFEHGFLFENPSNGAFIFVIVRGKSIADWNNHCEYAFISESVVWNCWEGPRNNW